MLFHFLPSGIDHLLPGEEPPTEAKMACYMALLMQLTVKPEVLRVSPKYRAKLLNSMTNAVVQSATTAETPLTDAGLDGKGEVIQVSPLISDGLIATASNACMILPQTEGNTTKIVTPTWIGSMIGTRYHIVVMPRPPTSNSAAFVLVFGGGAVRTGAVLAEQLPYHSKRSINLWLS